MANKASFTPEEWTKVMESVAVTGMAVTAAEPSGLWGMLKEALAGGAALAAAKADPNANELVKAVDRRFRDVRRAAHAVQDGAQAALRGRKARRRGAACARDVAAGLGNSRRQGAGRCAGLQGMAELCRGQGGGGLERKEAFSASAACR